MMCPMTRVLWTATCCVTSVACVAQDAEVVSAPRDHGVAAPAQESRGVVATRGAGGHGLVLGNAMDFLLVTDLETGKTQQHFMPAGVPGAYPYGSVMASNGKFYICHGKTFMEFDPAVRDWTFHGVPAKGEGCYIGFTESPDGRIWAGGCPKAHLISFDPRTRELRDYGRLDKAEKYVNSLAADSAGWVYGGIGTAHWNIVACNATTGEMRQLVEEETRQHGTASVYPSEDGKVYGVAGKQWFRLFEGRAEPIQPAQKRKAKVIGNIGWGNTKFDLPDGRKVTAYSMPDRVLKVFAPRTKQTQELAFDYKTEGAQITSLAAGPDGRIYGSSCHPMHFFVYTPPKDTLEDWGGIPAVGGGNFCAIAYQGNVLVGAQYSAGKLWAYDVTRPWDPDGGIGLPNLGLAGPDLHKRTSMAPEDGHFSLLSSEILFFHGDKPNADAHIQIEKPIDGDCFLYVLPYRSPKYGTVQFLLDGREIGSPHVGTGQSVEAGSVLEFGPFKGEAGAHKLTMRLAPGAKGTEPWFGIVSVGFSRTKRAETKSVPDGPWPRSLAQWHKDICRPRTALGHPDGKHVMMAGFAGYGLCGGGIGIFNLETGEEQLLKAEADLLPGHSCITLKALPNGDLVGGTSVAAPGGGHPVAKEGELFILDWTGRKVSHHVVPVPGDGNIVSIEVASDGLVYGLSGNSTLFVFDPVRRAVVHSERVSQYGGVPRHALHAGPDGYVYALMGNAVVRVKLGTFEHEKLTDVLAGARISAGGALHKGVLYYASGTHFWSYDVPGLE